MLSDERDHLLCCRTSILPVRHIYNPYILLFKKKKKNMYLMSFHKIFQQIGMLQIDVLITLGQFSDFGLFLVIWSEKI